MKATKLIAALLLVCMLIATLASCGGDKGDGDKTTSSTPVEGVGVHTYNTYTTLSPSNWNELTYKDNNDTQIMSYIGSSFFSYDYKFDADGNIIDGEFKVVYNAASALTDVTAEYAEAWGLPADGSGYAWKITLRNDLKWENGDPIDAADFVYTMQQQLDPAYQNYRADSYYVGSTIIKGAKEYAKQGQAGYFGAREVYTEYSEANDGNLFFKLGPSSESSVGTCFVRDYFGFPDSYNAAKTGAYLIDNYDMPATYEELLSLEGKSLAEIKADPALAPIWEAVLGWWKTQPNEELDFLVAYSQYPEVSWNTVGMLAPSTYDIVIILQNPLPLLKEDGSLAYYAAYNMSSLPLVHEATYEANRVAPSTAGGLWTSTYNSSVASTMSWGPYRLASFQTGKQYTLERNEYWYGYNMPENEGLYQTDRIVCDTIEEYNTAFTAFLAGQIDGIGIDVTVADDYKNSSSAYFTPDDFVASLQLQSDVEALKAREEAGVDKEIMGYVEFRKALSLAINRNAFAKDTTTSSLEGFGLFNSMHYYDVENGKAYRNSDEAKEVLCAIYGVDPSNFNSLDEAVDSITGYNLTLARELVVAAYNKALADKVISATDKVVITMGSGAINETVQRRFDWIANAWTELVKGTPLEGRLEFEVEDFADAWADDFRAGAYDVCMGGWTGAAWDPGYFLLAYLSPSYMYSAAWDTSSVEMTFTMELPEEFGGSVTETMSLMTWYNCLNGAAGAPYNWSSNALPQEYRLQLIAALEEQVLQVYYSVPLYNSFAASMLSYKVDYITYTYNTFMGYGGIKYMTYNFDDAEWAAQVAEVNGEFNYKI